MSSEFKPTYIHFGPSGGRPGRGYLMRVTSPEAGEFGGYEYFRIWVTVPKDMPEAIPTDEGFKTYRKIDWDADMDPGPLSASLMTTHDVYEFTSDEPPTLQRDNTTYHPYGRGSDQAYCIINSVVVCFNGMNHAKVVEVLAAYAKRKGVANGAVALKELRPYVLQTGDTANYKAYVFSDVAPGESDRNVMIFRLDSLDPVTYAGELGPLRLRSKWLSKYEGMKVGDTPDVSYGEARIVFGTVLNRSNGESRRVDYGTMADVLTPDEDRRSWSVEVKPLEERKDPPAETPVTPPVVATPDAATVEDTAIPSSEKRTRAQLYSALIAAEKYGDRTIRASRFEGNARQLGSDTYSHETVVKEAPNMTQGELVSLVTVLVNRIMADDVIIDAYNRAKSEGRVLDTPQRVPSVRIETNLIIGGVGYDPQ